MGLTKQYLRYSTYGIFNLICGHKSNILFVERNKRRLCVVGACENVIIWDLRKAEKVKYYLFFPIFKNISGIMSVEGRSKYNQYLKICLIVSTGGFRYYAAATRREIFGVNTLRGNYTT